MEVLLVCGIANPEPLKKYLHEEALTYEACYYNDHHIFSIDDLQEIKVTFPKSGCKRKNDHYNGKGCGQAGKVWR